jgi:hypothetical protein
MVFYIINSERNNEKFEKWFEETNKWIDTSKLAAFVTLFGSGNVELLHLLNSKFAGFQMFSAPFSEKALNWILWGGFINILFEDLPQLTIQVTLKFVLFHLIISYIY